MLLMSEVPLYREDAERGCENTVRERQTQRQRERANTRGNAERQMQRASGVRHAPRTESVQGYLTYKKTHSPRTLP